jgi:hypothetical protein
MTEVVTAGPLVTHGEGGSGKVLPFPTVESGPTRRRATPARDAGARASVPATNSDAKPRRGLAGAARTWVAEVVAEAGANKARRSIWSDPAESLAEHAAYIRAAAWSDAPLLILAGSLYGWLAFAVSAPVLAGVWLLRRPSRLFVATVVATVVWLTI